MSVEGTLKRIVGGACSEWLRFSDLYGRTDSQKFVSFATFFGSAFVGLKFASIVLANIKQFAVAHTLSSIASALALMLVVPFLVLFARRTQDTAYFRTVTSNSGGGSTRPRWAIVLVLLIAFSLFSLAFLLVGYWAIAILFIPAIFPSDSRVRVSRDTLIYQSSFNADGSSRIPPPPTPVSGRETSLTTSSENRKPRFGEVGYRDGAGERPKKTLVTRFWFWASILVVVVYLQGVLMPGSLRSGLENLLNLNPTFSSATTDPTLMPTSMPSPTSTSISTATPQALELVLDDNQVGAIRDDEEDSAADEIVGGVTLDARYRYCSDVVAMGLGPYKAGEDPEYDWYRDRDGDGIVCER